MYFEKYIDGCVVHDHSTQEEIHHRLILIFHFNSNIIIWIGPIVGRRHLSPTPSIKTNLTATPPSPSKTLEQRNPTMPSSAAAASTQKKPVHSKKRKVSDAPPPASDNKKKKSPLFNQPQNRYAPPDFTIMSPDEISEWRKEQRRERNRESAANSRNKNRAKLDELEGEVQHWKSKYYDMEQTMRIMQHQIDVLTRMCQQKQQNQGAVVDLPATQTRTVVSHPNSPVLPAAIPNSVTSLDDHIPSLPVFDHSSHPLLLTLSPSSSLFSKPMDHSPSLVEIQEAVAATAAKSAPHAVVDAAATTPTIADIESEEESWKHIIPISRPA